MHDLLETLGKYQSDCQEEDDFHQLYLQPRETQETIRAQNPEGRHCELLMQNSMACDGCRHNPMQGERLTDRHFVKPHLAALNAILETTLRHQYGLIPSELLHPCESTWCLITRQWIERRREERSSNLMANKLAEIMTEVLQSAFGGRSQT